MLSFMIVISRTKQNELDGCETILLCRTTVRTVALLKKMSSAHYLRQMLHSFHYLGFLTVNLVVTDDLQNSINNILFDHNLHCQSLQVIACPDFLSRFNF